MGITKTKQSQQIQSLIDHMSLEERIEAAENPESSPELLSELLSDESYIVMTMIASNPNTSPKTLRELAECEDFSIRESLAKNKNTPPDVLRKLAEDDLKATGSEFIIISLVCENPNCSAETLAYFADKYKDHYFYSTVYENFLEAIASNPNTLPETLLLLAKHRSAGEYTIQCLADNQNLPLEAALILMKDNNVSISLASDCKYPEVLSYLMKSDNMVVRACVSENPATSKEMLRQILSNELTSLQKKDSKNTQKKEEAVYVLQSLAGNKNCDRQIFLELLQVNDENINLNIAQNINTPTDILNTLAKNKIPAIREAVAENHSTLPNTLTLLQKDKSSIIRNIANESLKSKGKKGEQKFPQKINKGITW